ncbi:MAG TPA: histidine phosphatase family protein [Burkholderiales bacterium]|nr:histidine phosphatase family protein [Burkholderiales bacterium]
MIQLVGNMPLFTRPFLYLRHGETISNATGLIAGSTDVALTPRGRTQAEQAARVLRDAGVTAIYSSALRRARDTALIIARELELPVTPIVELGERNWGELEGKPRALRMPGTTPRRAETPEAFAQRVLAGLARIDAPMPLIVAHSGIYRVLCRALGVMEPEQPISNCVPLRFVPPPVTGAPWHAESLQGKV